MKDGDEFVVNVEMLLEDLKYFLYGQAYVDGKIAGTFIHVPPNRKIKWNVAAPSGNGKRVAFRFQESNENDKQIQLFQSLTSKKRSIHVVFNVADVESQSINKSYILCWYDYIL